MPSKIPMGIILCFVLSSTGLTEPRAEPVRRKHRGLLSRPQQGLGIGNLGEQANLLEDREDLLHLRGLEHGMKSVPLLLTECLAEALDKRPVNVTHALAGFVQPQHQVAQFFRASLFIVQASFKPGL